MIMVILKEYWVLFVSVVIAVLIIILQIVRAQKTGKNKRVPAPVTNPVAVSANTTPGFWKVLKKSIKWIVLVLIVVVGAYMAHRNHTYSRVMNRYNKPVCVEDVWRMRWNYQGQEYNLKVIMTRRDENHLEMTAFGNYPSKIKMVKQSDTSEYKWIGEFRNPPCPGGFMKLNEKLVLGEVVYEGFQMGRDDSDWITATIEKAW